MAKGKNNKKPKSITPSGDQDGEEVTTVSSEAMLDAEADPETLEDSQPPKEPEQQQPEAPASASGDSVREQLQAALEEVSSLKLLLANRDAEITLLKASAAPSATTAHSEDLQRLTDRLAVLKREQAEADAARETAWRQLKSVVGEITRLASTPETGSNPSTPGAASGLTMGRTVTASS